MDVPQMGTQDPIVSGSRKILVADYSFMGDEIPAKHNGEVTAFTSLFSPTSARSLSFGSTDTTLESQPWLDASSITFLGSANLPWLANNSFQNQPVFEAVPDIFGSPTPFGEREVSSTTFQISQPEVIPQQVLDLAAHINSLPKLRSGEYDDNVLPYRQTLKRDPLLKGEISRKSGCLRVEKRRGKLRKWYGDNRLFTDEMWKYLTDPEYMKVEKAGRSRERKKSESEDFTFVSMMPPSPSASPPSIPAAQKRRTSSSASNVKRNPVSTKVELHAPVCDIPKLPTDGTVAPATNINHTPPSGEKHTAELSTTSPNGEFSDFVLENTSSATESIDLTGMLAQDLEGISRT